MADLQGYYALGDDAEPPASLTGSASDTAEYLADMLAQFESLARRCGFDLLAYLLSMSRAEAQNLSRAPRDRDTLDSGAL